MAARRGKRRYRRRRRRRTAPSAAVAGYTRPIFLQREAPANNATALVTEDVPDIQTLPTHTQNRKILRVTGQAMFAANLAAGQYVLAQFCLWAHPDHESWPTVTDYDPFNEGPGETAFDGMLAPRAFCRRTFVLQTPSGGVTEVIQDQHMIRSKAERLLRPGWKLTAGLYVRGTSGVQCNHTSLLRYVVAD